MTEITLKMGSACLEKHTIVSLSEAMHIGLAACAYAREKIVKGSTQLENNLLSKKRFKALKGAIGEKHTQQGLSVREATEQRVLSEITASSSDSGDYTETAVILQYESIILMSGKYSLGNCAELSMQALDYILNRVKKIFMLKCVTSQTVTTYLSC